MAGSAEAQARSRLLPRALQRKGISQSLSSTLGVPGRSQFLKGGDCDCSHCRSPQHLPKTTVGMQ